jgi:membrane protease subunit HflK
VFDKLVEVLLQFVHLFFFCFITMSYQQGVVLRWGQLHRVVGPGFHWKWPFCVEHYLFVNTVPETMTVGPQSLTTKDGRSVVVSTIVTFSVEDVAKFLLEIEGGHQVIEDSTYGTVADFVMRRTWDDLCQFEAQFGNELSKVVRRRSKMYGVNVINVQLCDFTASRSIRLIQPLGHHSHGSV